MPPKLRRAARNRQEKQVAFRAMLKVRVAKRMRARRKTGVLTEKMIMARMRTWACKMMKKNLATI